MLRQHLHLHNPLAIENTALHLLLHRSLLSLQKFRQLLHQLKIFQPSHLLLRWLEKSNVIQFQANGTYADITDSIAVGSSKTYSINAMKGQIMSISILPQIPDGSWGYIPMKIKGADGSVLCPQLPDTECMFWRGVLPSSQDYFVTLTPDSDDASICHACRDQPAWERRSIFSI